MNNREYTLEQQADFLFTALGTFVEFALGKTKNQIKEMFSEPGALNILETRTEAHYFEIRKGNATVLCMFAEDICKRCFLFPDMSVSLDFYCKILNQEATPVRRDKWKAEGIHIYVVAQGEDAFFYFHL